MSFVLPGNARQLRFTGEVKAFVTGKDMRTPESGVPLGKPRTRTNTRSPAALPAVPKVLRQPEQAPIQTPVPSPAARATPYPAAYATPYTTPYTTDEYARVAPHARPKMRGLGRAEDGASFLGRAEDGASFIDDEQPTMAMDREGLDILPGGHHGGQPYPGAALRPTQPPPGGAAIPHFRPAQRMAPRANIAPGDPVADARKISGAPLALWLFAAVLAGVVSYHVAPSLMNHFEPGAATLTAR